MWFLFSSTEFMQRLVPLLCAWLNSKCNSLLEWSSIVYLVSWFLNIQPSLTHAKLSWQWMCKYLLHFLEMCEIVARTLHCSSDECLSTHCLYTALVSKRSGHHLIYVLCFRVRCWQSFFEENSCFSYLPTHCQLSQATQTPTGCFIKGIIR